MTRVAIIGSGFGGLAAAVRLKQAGVEGLVLFEKSHDVGGVTARDVALDDFLTASAKHELERSYHKLPTRRIRAPSGDEDAGCAHCSVESGAGGALAFGLGLLGITNLRRRKQPQ